MDGAPTRNACTDTPRSRATSRPRLPRSIRRRPPPKNTDLPYSGGVHEASLSACGSCAGRAGLPGLECGGVPEWRVSLPYPAVQRTRFSVTAIRAWCGVGAAARLGVAAAAALAGAGDRELLCDG